MFNSVVHNNNNSVVDGNFQTQVKGATNGAASKCLTATVKQKQTNILLNYLQTMAISNQAHLLNLNKEPAYSHAFGEFDNMEVRDIQGNLVQKVDFKRDGNKITQEIYVKATNGSTVNKKITANGTTTKMEFYLKDRNGNLIGKETRGYKKLSQDCAISAHNGKIYKISGLSGNIITIETDGEKHTIDLNKKVQDISETIDGKTTGRELTQEERNYLISRIKKQQGDIILTFDKEIDKIALLDFDDYEGFYENAQGTRTLKISKHGDGALDLHELGHAVNEISHSNTEHAHWSDNIDYVNAREIEITNFNKHQTNPNLKWRMQKFMNCDYFVADGMDRNLAKQKGADEEFAELYSFINNTDIENMNYRTTCLLQYMPNSTKIAYGKISNC